ncbi:MAG: glycosyltransferase [Oscillospiraceae bacterium]|nr:glycosyltransferase [Oscillospiraceae bacterium]
MKILHVITDSNIGGAGTVLLNLMRNADRTRFEYTVAVPQGSKLVPELRALNIGVVEMPGIGEKSLNLAAISGFRKLIREIRPDVVHTHASLSARIAAKLSGNTKIVHTRHSVFDVTPEQKRFYRRFISSIINNIFSDRIIAVSPAAAENLIDLGTSPKKITVVFNGAEPARALTEAEKTDARDEFGVNADDFVCAIIARLEEVKGHRYILEAAKWLRECPIKILVAGTGVLDAELRELAAREKLDNVIFTGFVREIYKVENIMDIQLNASYGTEATSLALLEGMSLSKPAIVSDFGGNPYVIRDGENGLVVPKRDAAALANAILRLYGDRALTARLGEQAKRDYDATFTAEVMAHNTENVYLEVLK